MDQKNLAKTLATRLNTLLGKLVNPDQTGFVSGRSSFNNLCRLFNILYSSQTNQSDLVILSLDTEKAFDQVEWPYLFALLQKFHVGEKFITWLKILCNDPRARILTNRILSPSFALFRGTRQGCPLSPLLFALAIEPLVEAIRSDERIHGLHTKTTINKKILYADDILLYVTKPASSIPVILKVIEQYGSFSGYRKVNSCQLGLKIFHKFSQFGLK